jgi:hypothetical protein
MLNSNNENKKNIYYKSLKDLIETLNQMNL